MFEKKDMQSKGKKGDKSLWEVTTELRGEKGLVRGRIRERKTNIMLDRWMDFQLRGTKEEEKREIQYIRK